MFFDASISISSSNAGLTFLETMEHLNDFRAVDSIVNGFAGFPGFENSSVLHEGELVRGERLGSPEGFLNFPYGHLTVLKEFCDSKSDGMGDRFQDAGGTLHFFPVQQNRFCLSHLGSSLCYE